MVTKHLLRLILLGDINIPPDKIQTSCLLSLFSIYSLCFSTTGFPTTKDLVFSQPSSATDISDHHLLFFTTSLSVQFKSSHYCFSPTRTILQSTSPSSTAPDSSTLFHLPVPDTFTCQPLELATDTLLSSLSLCLDLLCQLSFKTKRTSCPAPWLSDVQ